MNAIENVALTLQNDYAFYQLAQSGKSSEAKTRALRLIREHHDDFPRDQTVEAMRMAYEYHELKLD